MLDGGRSQPRPRFVSPVGDETLRRERARARVLRASPWWRRRLRTGRCGYCDRPTPPSELTMDHRVPLVRGGRSVKENLVPACRACNAAKQSLLPIEWVAYLERLEKKPWTAGDSES